MKTHSQVCKAAMRSLFRLLEAIEAEPHRAKDLTALRHLSAMRITDPEPIEHSTPRAVLHHPHPLAGHTHGLVGNFDLYDHYRSTGETVAGWAGWSVRRDGSIEFVASDGCVSRPYQADSVQQTLHDPAVMPLGYSAVRDCNDWIGFGWYSEDYSEHLDPFMPRDDRERIATVLETAGVEPDERMKGEAGCRTTGKLRSHSERYLPDSVDRLANLSELHWCPVALAALVRDHGLRIRPDILRRLGVGIDGRPLPFAEEIGHGA